MLCRDCKERSINVETSLDYEEEYIVTFFVCRKCGYKEETRIQAEICYEEVEGD